MARTKAMKKEFSRIAPGQLKILRKQENGKDKEDRCPDRVSANSRTPREQSRAIGEPTPSEDTPSGAWQDRDRMQGSQPTQA